MLKKTYRPRLFQLYLIPVLLLAVVAARLFYLQVARYDHYRSLADAQHHKRVYISPSRGKILDRNGHELAGSTQLQAAYVAPSLIRTEFAADLAHDLAKVLNLDFEYVHKRLVGMREVPLARKLDDKQAQALQDLMFRYERQKKVPASAIYLVNEGKRYYPRGDLASHVIGYTELDDTGDNKGRAGIELTCNDPLRGKATIIRTRTNAIQSSLEPIDSGVLGATYGNSVVLTIDDTIQHAAEMALRKRVAECAADSAMAVVYAVKTGEVLAMANVPTFSLNELKSAADFQRRNRAVNDAVEPGSVMKIFTFTTLLEDKKISLEEPVNCEGGRWTILGRTVTDAGGHGMGTVPAKDVFKMSSNVGTVKLATRLTPSRFYRHLIDFGFGEKTGIELPGEREGLLRPLKSWSALSMSSIPMGYEIQVTGIQVAAAAAAIVNGGIYMQPHIVKEYRDYRDQVVKRFDPVELRRVCSPETSKLMLGPHGTRGHERHRQAGRACRLQRGRQDRHDEEDRSRDAPLLDAHLPRVVLRRCARRGSAGHHLHLHRQPARRGVLWRHRQRAGLQGDRGSVDEGAQGSRHPQYEAAGTGTGDCRESAVAAAG